MTNLISNVERLHEIVLGEKCFVNEKFLVKPGMVYVPKSLGEELVSKTSPHKVFAVFNALNGMLPVLLHKAYPEAKIVCIEHFPFFVKHLTKMGFESYLYTDDSWKNNPMKDINGKDIEKSDILTVMNPPYNDNMDLDFIQSAIKISDRVIAVHPAVSTISRFDKKFDEYKKVIDGHVKSIKLFNGNPIFDIGLFYPCQIVEINMADNYKTIDVEYSMNGKTEKYNFSSIFDINRWGNIPEYFSLEKKILKYCSEVDNCNNHGNSKNVTKHFVGAAKVRGHVDSKNMFHPDFYTFLPKDQKTEKPHYTFYFDSEEEALNFENYLKGNFARFCLSILKTKAHIVGIQWKGIPYLSSYKAPWTKERLTELFNITDEEWIFIENAIPKYY